MLVNVLLRSANGHPEGLDPRLPLCDLFAESFARFIGNGLISSQASSIADLMCRHAYVLRLYVNMGNGRGGVRCGSRLVSLSYCVSSFL